MNHGLDDYEKFKVIRPLLGNHKCDEVNHMPIMHKVTIDMLDIHRAKPLNLQNLNSKHNNSDKIVFSFRYDKDLKRYWDDPLKYIPVLQTAMAVGTPDFSAYPSMNSNEIRHNIFKSRWLGCLWQTYGCLAIPTLAWALPDTYDICLGAVEYAHHGISPHKHIYLDHSDKGIPISSEEQALINKIRRRFNLK